MNRAMVVPLQVPGVGTAVAGLNQVAGAYGNINRAQAQVMRQQAQGINAALALRNAQARLARANAAPPSFMQRLGNLALSTRVNFGGQDFGASPLVGRLLSAAGIGGAAAGPIGVIAGAAALAAQGLRAVAVAGMEGGRALKSMSDLATLSGAAPGQAGTLRAYGLDAGFAASLRERLATDPMAMMAGARIGLGRVLPTMFGNQNNAAVVEKVVERLLAVKKAGGNPTLAARMLGAESLLPLLNMSDKARASLLKTAGALDRLAAANKTASADWDAATKRLDLSSERLKGAIFGKLSPALIQLTERVSDVADAVSGQISRHPRAAKAAAAGGVAPFAVPPMVGLPGSLPMVLFAAFAAWKAWQGSQAGGGQNNALKNNTQAINNLTHLLKGQVYGGGPRAAGALPAGLNQFQLNQMLQNSAHRMGHWTL